LGHLNTPRLLFGRKDADGAVVFWVMGNDGYTGKKKHLIKPKNKPSLM
jgi:hypothetical protein